MRNHLAANFHLAFVERRRIDRNQQARTHFNQLLSGIVGVQSLPPERLVVPEVFANRYAEPGVTEIEQTTFLPRLEITRIVENVVFGEQSFVGKSQQSSVRNHRG